MTVSFRLLSFRFPVKLQVPLIFSLPVKHQAFHQALGTPWSVKNLKRLSALQQIGQQSCNGFFEFNSQRTSPVFF